MRRVVIGVALVFASSTPGFSSDPGASPLTQSQVSMAAYVLVADRLTADPYQWYSAAGLRVALKGESTDPARERVVKIVSQIQRADYEGDRAALKRLYSDLAPVPEDKRLASRVLYWRGFALWRRAANGFNDTSDTKEIGEDLEQAVNEFNDSLAKDPGFADAEAGAASCLNSLIFLNRKDRARVQELVAKAGPLLKQAEAAAPDNPRLLWVLGSIRWYVPPERGGGQDKALAAQQKGLEDIREHKESAGDPLEPTWGEPELLMSLAWSNLNRTTPDLNAAEQYAQAALKLVPYWHYVRDILMPQIRAAQVKAAKG
jgi:tetratricopeptide (TPR) repeat protein